ncbi:MAG: hypothetical protein LBV00_10660, partial [Propionibacteriaceae bacterium]|nr:hypothetical protein [Propionibacteriaceae bacterium]
MERTAAQFATRLGGRGDACLTKRGASWSKASQSGKAAEFTQLGYTLASRIAEEADMTYRFISWNIDSLNAALTSSSDRAQLSMGVVRDLARADADIIALQEIKLSEDAQRHAGLFEQLARLFPDHELDYRVSTPPARKGYAGTMTLRRR